MLVKNLRGQEGFMPDSYTDETKQVYENGQAVPVQSIINKRRKRMGLEEASKPNVKEIRKLMDMTPVKYVLKRKAEQKAEEKKLKEEMKKKGEENK
jgi:hypothetical protein